MTARSSLMSALVPLTLIVMCFVAPPIMAQIATPDAQAAKQDGKNFATQAKEQASNIADQDVTAETIPGYQPPPSGLSDLFDENDSNLNAASGSAVGNDTWQTMMGGDANRANIDPASLDDIRAKADLINENAAVDQLGGGVTSTAGICEEITVPQSQPRYEATCDVGVTVSEEAQVESYSCPAGWDLNGTSCQRVETQSADLSYACPSGSTLNGTSCQSSLPASIASYSCPSGFSLTQTTCSQTITQSASIASYSCPADFNLVGTNCQQTITQSATPNYSCPSGSTLSGTSCIQNASYAATPSYSCASGYSYDGSNCVQSSNYAAMAAYYCPSGYTLSGETCTLVSSQSATPTYECSPPTFGSLNTNIDNQVFCILVMEASQGILCPGYNTEWFVYSTEVVNVFGVDFFSCYYKPNTTYTCPGGAWQINDNICYNTVTQSASISGYSCPNGGILVGTNCVTTSTVSPSISYSCPNGGTLAGTSCNVSSSSSATVSYSCPANFTLNGSNCSQTQTSVATPVYSCPSGYVLSGSSCSSTQAQPATPNYACPSGFSLSGTVCSMSVQASPVYSCPQGFELDGTTCSKVLVQAATVTMVCPDGTTVQDGKCYGETAGSPECADLEQNAQCQWVKDTCLDEEPNGACKVTEKTFNCPIPGEVAPEVKEYVCSGDLYCTNGSCETIEREASNEFKDALVAMGAIDQVQKEFDSDALGLFKGTRETCHKPVFGLVNCCAGKVSGLLSGGSAAAAYAALGSGGLAAIAGIATQFLTTFLCSAEEKQLDVKDRLGLCVKIGSYCSSSFLGVCKTKRKAYCCFESKLTRILQQQGRPQINKPWDKPKTEQCKGFTVDEFSKLDLSTMDFSEIYSEFLEAAKLPNEAQMALDIQAKIQQYYQTNAPGGS